MCGGAQEYLVDNLIDRDQIVSTVTYQVAGHVVKRSIYIWTLIVPVPAQWLQHCQPSTNGADCDVVKRCLDHQTEKRA